MAGRPIGGIVTIRQAVSMHNRTLTAAVRLRRYSRLPWSFLFYPVTLLNKVREKRALVALVDLEPRHPDEAQEKLIYLLALMSSNASHLQTSDVQRAIQTMHPFRSHLAEALGSKSAKVPMTVVEDLQPMSKAERHRPRSDADCTNR